MSAPSNANTSGLAPTDALRLVPVEPTEAMQNAGVDAATNLFEGWVDEGQVSTLYRAMLAAAPASPLPGGGWQDISTAPRTGEEFQAWWKGTWQPRARFDPEYGSFQLWGRTDFDTEGWEVFEIEGYWQPQPAAPTGEPK